MVPYVRTGTELEIYRRLTEAAEFLERLAEEQILVADANDYYRAAECLRDGDLYDAHERMARLDGVELIDGTWRDLPGEPCPHCGEVTTDASGEGVYSLVGVAGSACCAPFLAPEGV